MITQDHITFSPDATAWAVADDPRDLWGVDEVFDKPCDYCQRNDLSPMSAIGFVCPAMCVDGRHTFYIEVGDWNQADHTIASYCEVVKTYRASIVPGMVLPIHPWNDASLDHVPSIEDRGGSLGGEEEARFWLYDQAWCDDYDGTVDPVAVTLPPAAQPGMWAVKLKVAS